MPYIDAETARFLRPTVDKLYNALREATFADSHDGIYGTKLYGAAEYAIFRILGLLVQDEPSFHNLNALVGVLETTKLELARRFLAPLEDQKLIGSWLDDD